MREGYSVMRPKDYLGCPLHVVVDELISYRNSGRRVCVEFNGVWLYSEDVDMDEAYIKVTGLTREELEEYKNKRGEY